MGKYLGIDLGGTNLKSGVMDDNDELSRQTIKPTAANRKPREIIADIEGLIRSAREAFPDLETVGVGVPGPVSSAGVVAIAPNLPGWVEIPLGEILRQSTDLPVAVDNDANTGALAEMTLGAGADAENFIYVTLGTGVGGAIIINRKLFRGDTGAAGEIGHLIIDINARPNRERPYRTGILEEYVGRNQIAYSAGRILRKYRDSPLLAFPKQEPFKISQAAEAGDPAALEILQTAGVYLGTALAGVMNLLDIRLVVYGGGISQSHESMFIAAMETIKERALPPIAAGARLVKARFHKEAGIYGAAMLGKTNRKKT